MWKNKPWSIVAWYEMSHCRTNDISCCCCIQTQQNPTQTFSKTRLRCGLITTIGLILIKQSLDSFYNCMPNTQLFFAVFFLCWFACVQSSVENLRCISNLDVCIEIENFWDWFIVCIDELMAHGSFCDNHKWIHTVERSIQTKPQSFIIVVVTSILMYVCISSWHECRGSDSEFVKFSYVPNTNSEYSDLLN